jgi:hypothetical protein
VLGWSWKFQEIVFLDRDWEKDRKNLGAQLSRLAAYPDPIWVKNTFFLSFLILFDLLCVANFVSGRNSLHSREVCRKYGSGEGKGSSYLEASSSPKDKGFCRKYSLP